MVVVIKKGKITRVGPRTIGKVPSEQGGNGKERSRKLWMGGPLHK